MNLILQHWSGPMPEIVERSWGNVSLYADHVGAYYQMRHGDAFDGRLSAPCQKLVMLEEDYDDFDTVVMLDADMFTRTSESIFDVEGVGISTPYQADIFARMGRTLPELTDTRYPYWGGAIWKLTREMRQEFRSHLTDDIVQAFSGQGNFEDEGIMHRLATMADYKTDTFIPERWSWASYDEDSIEDAAMIHVRARKVPWGCGVPKRDATGTKIENYRALVERGILS